MNPKPYMTTATAASGGTIKPIKEDTLSAAEVKQIIDHIDRKFDDAPRKFWAYDQGGKTPQAWHFQKNVGKVVAVSVWAHKLKSYTGKLYTAAGFLVNNNTNGWKIPGIEKLVKAIAGRSGVEKADLDAAVAQIDANTEAALVDAAIDVTVTVNDKDKI